MPRLRHSVAVFVLVLGTAHAAVRPTSTPAASAADSDVVNIQLKNAVLGSQSQLPEMDPAQKKIFDEEVVPQYPLFIRDYKRVAGKVDAQLDLEGIKNLIRFSAQKNLKPGNTKILLSLVAASGCSKCVDEAPPIRKLMQVRVERRGFIPVWIGPDELSPGAKISELVGPRGTVGYLQVELVPVSQDDVDSAHADEKRFLTKVQFEVRDVAGFMDQSEIFDTDSFLTESDKLLTHAFTELGARSDIASISSQGQEDILIEVNKIASFAQYSKLKAELQGRIKAVALLEERKISRGSATFAVKTKTSLDELKALLKGATLDGNKEVVMLPGASNVPSATGPTSAGQASAASPPSSNQTIQMEIR
jgi:hypothetical protein